VSFPVARVAPTGFRGVIRRPPMAPVPVPHTVTIGICDVGTLFDGQMFDQQHASRILCDERGQLYEWRAEQLRPLSAHQLPQVVTSAPDRGYRMLFPEPGYPLVVCWNEFDSLLSSQIANPERLRDGHRVGVHAQVYEVTRPQSLDEIAESITGDAGKAAQFAILTDTLASLLGLTPRLPPRMRHPYQQPHGETLVAHERIVRLQLASDPTSATSAAAAQHDAIAPRTRADRESIPQAFLRPWEFKKSREDVLYELTRRQGVIRAIRSWLGSIASRLSGRVEHRCWELLRSGKSVDEQLWSVRPPRRGLDDREVRDWAARTLEQSGYNAQSMLLEWEIFWRRKLG
jgi:hypothetical protein